MKKNFPFYINFSVVIFIKIGRMFISGIIKLLILKEL